VTWLDQVTFQTVIVLTTEGHSFKGLRRAVHDDCIVLHEAMLLEEDSSTVLNGDFVIPREKVLGIQVIHTTGDGAA
jgi:hypothetical protein